MLFVVSSFSVRRKQIRCIPQAVMFRYANSYFDVFLLCCNCNWQVIFQMAGHTVGDSIGKWSTWTLWSECSRQCDSGVSYQRRECSGLGRCIGDIVRYRVCNNGVSTPEYLAPIPPLNCVYMYNAVYRQLHNFSMHLIYTTKCLKEKKIRTRWINVT